MSTSISEKILYAPESLYGAGKDPVDSVLTRRIVANNLMHAGDSAAQVRVNWWTIGDDTSGGGDLFLEMLEPSGGTLVANTYYLMQGFPFGPFPLTLRADGTPYRLKCYAACAVSSGSALATFQLVIAPSYANAVATLEADVDRRGSFGASSTSVTQPNITSADSGNLNYLDVTRDEAGAWTREIPTFDAVSSASPVNVQMCLVSAWVFAKTATITSVPRLYGLHISEFCNP